MTLGAGGVTGTPMEVSSPDDNLVFSDCLNLYEENPALFQVSVDEFERDRADLASSTLSDLDLDLVEFDNIP